MGAGNHFKTSEFACQCNYKDCIEQKISKDIIKKLVIVREKINEPIHITSAFRCKKHQNDLRTQEVNTVVAAKTSTHELGDAVDIKPTRMKIKDFLVFCAQEFEAIGIALTFLHCDLRTGKERRWKY